MKSYWSKIEHLIGKETQYISYPNINANSFTMAVAHFERLALTDARCGVIQKIEVYTENFGNPHIPIKNR